MFQFQLIPSDRIQDHFQDQLKIHVSTGSIYNFNRLAYDKLAEFERGLKSKLQSSKFLHADETGINIDSKRRWLHCLSSDQFTYLYPNQKRGKEAMDEMGVLPDYAGTLCHDHWKPYYRFKCTHVLCNAHHIRELDRASEQDNQQWAERLKELLLEINKAVSDAGGQLNGMKSDAFRIKYRKFWNLLRRNVRYRKRNPKLKREVELLNQKQGIFWSVSLIMKTMS
jgi:transposase